MNRIKQFIRFYLESRISTLSGSLCFFLLLNGGSYIFLIVSITSMFIEPNVYINTLLNDGILKEVLLYLFQHSSSLSSNIILFITSIYSSSSLYYHFIHAGEIITDGSINYKYSKRITAIILTLILILVMTVIGIIISLLPFIFNITSFISYILGSIVMVLIIYVMNKIILKGHSIKALRFGVIFSTVYVILFTIGFVVFLSIFSGFKAVYGYLSIIIVFLFYLYVIIIGILLGIRINWKKLEA